MHIQNQIKIIGLVPLYGYDGMVEVPLSRFVLRYLKMGKSYSPIHLLGGLNYKNTANLIKEEKL